MASPRAMSAFEQWFEKAATAGPDRLVPSSVVIAADRDGIIYTKSAGTQSEDQDSPLVDKPISPSTVMWIASCTKLMTAICILQLVEAGLLDLDADIDALLPEYADPQIFTGFTGPDRSPTFAKADTKITIRMMLSHQSGIGYNIVHSYIDKLNAIKSDAGEDVPSKLEWESHINPLLSPPATTWHYGANFELLGRIIERVTALPLAAYMQSHIWAPLGMRQITFHLHTRPDVEAEIGEMALRVPSGEIEAVGSRFWPDETEFDSGGAGAYSSMAEYVKVLIAVLRNDGTLLKPATMDLLFQPQLSPAVQTTLDKTLYANGGLPVFSANLPPSARLTQALGGTVCLSDVVGDATGGSGRRRNKGSLSWSGLPNVWWMIDPTA